MKAKGPTLHIVSADSDLLIFQHF